MSKPSISLRYYLQLTEFQEAFKVASFGQKGIMAWITTVLATAMMLYGAYLGFDKGKFYIIFGAVFSIMQLLIRFYLVPMLFKRQFTKNKLDSIERGIDLYQTEFAIWHNGREQRCNYQDVHKTAEGVSCYVLELKNRHSVIVPKSAFRDAEQQEMFKNQFKL